MAARGDRVLTEAEELELADSLFIPVEEYDNDPEWIADIKRALQEALDDPRPPIPAAEVFAELKRRHAELVARDA